MLYIYTSVEHLIEHFQVFNILKCEIAADIQAEECRKCRNCTFQNAEHLHTYKCWTLIKQVLKQVLKRFKMQILFFLFNRTKKTRLLVSSISRLL